MLCIMYFHNNCEASKPVHNISSPHCVQSLFNLLSPLLIKSKYDISGSHGSDAQYDTVKFEIYVPNFKASHTSPRKKKVI